MGRQSALALTWRRSCPGGLPAGLRPIHSTTATRPADGHKYTINGYHGQAAGHQALKSVKPTSPVRTRQTHMAATPPSGITGEGIAEDLEDGQQSDPEPAITSERPRMYP